MSAGARSGPSTADVEIDSGTWGLLGGTFDPVHYGHLAIAEQTRETLGLAGVMFVPARTPPHKPSSIVWPAEHREAMVALAISDNPCFRLSRIELERPGPSYAVETAERLRQESSNEFVFILSMEVLSTLPTWRDPDRLLELCRIAVVPRPEYPSLGRDWVAQHFAGREDRILFLSGPRLGHSASDIRRRVEEGRSIRYLVPPLVERYILDHALYRTAP
jgi:nicotinate-nucleotide adenylyltransferase